MYKYVCMYVCIFFFFFQLRSELLPTWLRMDDDFVGETNWVSELTRLHISLSQLVLIWVFCFCFCWIFVFVFTSVFSFGLSEAICRTSSARLLVFS